MVDFHKLFVGVSALSVFGSMNIMKAEPVKNPRMNVLFIAIDDMKPAIAPYGDPIAQTPAMTELASRGTTFTNAYCQLALSGPSRSSLLTGLNPDHTGVWWLMGSFRNNNPDITTLPQCFKDQGYETVGVGKVFHPLKNKKLRNDPESWSKPSINPSAPAYRLANGRVATECADVPDNGYTDGLIAEAAIREMKQLKDSDKPFFLAVGFKKPHLPFCAPKKYWDMYDRDMMPVAQFQDSARNAIEYAYHNSLELKGYSDIPPFESFIDTRHLDTDTQRRLLHAYYACISYVDAQVGKLLDALDENGLADNTAIVLFGDHGYHMGDHGMWNKISDFENATHVPMLIAAPGMKQGAVSASMASFVDIFPTLCDLTGVTPPQHLDGKSLVPVLKNPKARVSDYAISQVSRYTAENYTIATDTDIEGKADYLAIDIMGYSIRDNRYRLVEWTKGFKTYQPFDDNVEIIGYELYDYTKDPLETVNVADDPKYAKIAARLKKQLHSYYAESYRSPMSAPISECVNR